jgi:hypothetical protein
VDWSSVVAIDFPVDHARQLNIASPTGPSIFFEEAISR